jgi:hypothetical protein
MATSLTKEHFDRRMDELTATISMLQQENKVLKTENKLLKLELIKVKSSALRVDLHTRRNNILLHGIDTPNESENLRDTVKNFFGKKLGIADPDQIGISVAYRVKKSTASDDGVGPSLRSGRKKTVEPIFVQLKNYDRSLILKECGKLKKTGYSVSTDLPAELGKRRKELLALGYKLKNAKGAEKVSETRVVQRNVKLWLETKKSKSSQQWVKYDDDCFDPLKLFAKNDPEEVVSDQ